MFGLSVKAKYGLAAMMALAAEENSGPMQIKTIASLKCIPQNYLELVLVELKKAGYVKSFRGAQGGYTLNKSPEDISVYELLLHLEGPIQLTGHDCDCESLSQFWTDVEDGIKERLNITLADLIARKNKIKKVAMYAI